MYKIILPPCQTFVSACVAIPLGSVCRGVCQCIQRDFAICDFGRLRYCYVYHTGLTDYKTEYGHILIAGFGIAVRYIDSHGKRKSLFYESSIVFHDGAGKFDCTNLDVRFTDLVCDIDRKGNTTAMFKVELRPRRNAPDRSDTGT